MTQIRELLPRGGRLSTQAWASRHKAVAALLWVHVVGVVAFGTFVGAEGGQIVLAALLVGLFAWGATRGRRRNLRMCMATMGLFASSAVLLQLSDGAIAFHFHFFVMMAVIALYQEWFPFLLAIGFVLVHDGLLGAVNAGSTHDHPGVWASPWRWAVVHGGFLLAASTASVVAWRVNERAGDELREAQDRFEEAFRYAPIGMALVGLDGRWLETNESLSRITGYSKRELMHKTFQDITHPEDLDRDLAQVERVLSGEIDRYQMEKRYITASGDTVPIFLRVTLVRDRDGEARYFVAQIEDISEHKRAEEYYRRLYEGERAVVRELDEAHRLKSELFNIVSHEFKTPLAGIIGFAGLLSKKGGRLNDEQKEQYLETIARQAERLNRLVENLFVSAREIVPSEDAIGHLQDALRAVQAQLVDSFDDVQLDITIPSGLQLKISQEALRLVVANLASNAVKHAAPNSVVEIVAAREEGFVAVSVSNEGEPIPDETRERMFEPFFQSRATGRTAEGVGLGLHIVRKIVTAYGGTVSLEELDARVTFTVRLPEARSQEGSAIHLERVESRS